MNWTVNISREAAKHMRRLPGDRRDQLSRAFEGMGLDPLQGDVVPIKSGKFKGALRKRVGRYRIIFVLDSSNRQVEIGAVLTRSEKTYQ